MSSQAERNLQILRPALLTVLTELIDIDLEELVALPSTMVSELLAPKVYDELLKQYFTGVNNFLFAVERDGLGIDPALMQAVDFIWRLSYAQRNRPLPKESSFAVRLARLQDNIVGQIHYKAGNLSPNRKIWHQYFDAIDFSLIPEITADVPNTTDGIEELLKEQYPGMFVYGTASGGRCRYAAINNFKTGWEQFLFLMLLGTGVLKQTSTLPLRHKDAAELRELVAAFKVISTLK